MRPENYCLVNNRERKIMCTVIREHEIRRRYKRRVQKLVNGQGVREYDLYYFMNILSFSLLFIKYIMWVYSTNLDIDQIKTYLTLSFLA